MAAGGALGASARYLLGRASGRLFGFGFPWGTLTVNVLGCFLMGVLIEAMALRWPVHNELRAFLTVGVLGGFTTFSAFSADFALFWRATTMSAPASISLRRLAYPSPRSSPGSRLRVRSSHEDPL